MSQDGITRRDFVANSSLAFGAMIVPRHVLGRGYRAPSDTLNFAVVGMGQQGTENTESLIDENLVAVCDVDFSFTERQVTGKAKDRQGADRPQGVRLNEQFAKAKRYADFRRMLDEQRNSIDAVVVATPDHLHAVVAKAAMQLGKHVYVQKPLTYSVLEARVLARVARETGVVTQMGNQGHSSNDARRINEIVQAGVIGPVREVFVWTNRPIWPQGVPRPVSAEPSSEAPARWNMPTVQGRLSAALAGSYPAPDGLNWQLYLGPVPEDIAYHPIYHPFNWRGWTAFGVGALGDMGAHLIDHPYWALDLGYPTSIVASSTPWGTTQVPQTNAEGQQRNRSLEVSYPQAMVVHYEFPRRGLQPPVKLSWYDGGLIPPRPPELPDDIRLSGEGGAVLIGERGVLLHETYGRNPRVFPESLREEADAVPETLPRITGSHQVNFAQACKGEAQASSPFEYGARLTEVMLLGIVALRAGQGRKILYDGDTMTVTNVPEANRYLTREYRPGWEV